MPVASKLQAFDFETLTVDATAGGVRLSLAKILKTPHAKSAVLTLQTAPIRYTLDGTTVTSSLGHVANPTDVIGLNNPQELETFRAIRTGATSGTLSVSYYR